MNVFDLFRPKKSATGKSVKEDANANFGADAVDSTSPIHGESASKLKRRNGQKSTKSSKVDEGIEIVYEFSGQDSNKEGFKKSQNAGVRDIINRAYREVPGVKTDQEALAGFIARQSDALDAEEKENRKQSKQIHAMANDLRDKEKRFRAFTAQVANKPELSSKEKAKMAQQIEKEVEKDLEQRGVIGDIPTPPPETTTAQEPTQAQAEPAVAADTAAQGVPVNKTVGVTGPKGAVGATGAQGATTPAKPVTTPTSAPTPTDAGARAFGSIAGQLSALPSTSYAAKPTTADKLKTSAEKGNEYTPTDDADSDELDDLNIISPDDVLTPDKEKETAKHESIDLSEESYSEGNPNRGSLNWTILGKAWMSRMPSVDLEFGNLKRMRLYRPQMFALLQVVGNKTPVEKEDVIHNIFSVRQKLQDLLADPMTKRYMEYFPKWEQEQEQKLAAPEQPSLIEPTGQVAQQNINPEPKQTELFNGAMDEDAKPRLTRIHYFRVDDPKVAALAGLKQDKGGNWVMYQFNTSGAPFNVKYSQAVKMFGHPTKSVSVNEGSIKTKKISDIKRNIFAHHGLLGDVKVLKVKDNSAYVTDRHGFETRVGIATLVPKLDKTNFAEGFQDFGKKEPYAVCLAGKPVKKFDYYEDARRFHDNWKQKLYREGNKEKADKITLMPLNLDESGVTEGRPITATPNAIANAKKLWQYVGRNLDDLASNADFDAERNEFYIDDKLNNLFTTANGQAVKVAFDMGSSIEFDKGILYIPIGTMWKYRGWYTPEKFVNKVVQALGEQDVAEASSPAQQAAIAIAMKKAHKKPKHVDESERDFRSIILKVMSKVFVDGGGGNLSYMIELKAPTMTALRAKYHDDLDAMFAKADPKELKQAAAELSAMFSKQVAEDTGSWIVYDPATKQIKKRFKTHTAGKSYAKTHGLGFASSEYYFDNIKQGVAEGADQVKKVFKDKFGKPVGEIGIDPESSPGNGEWYVYHYATGYSVVGFDSAAEAKRELMYVHKHPEAVEGHPSTKEQGMAEASPSVNIRSLAADVSSTFSRESQRFSGQPTAQLLAPVLQKYGVTMQQLETLLPQGLKRAAAEFGVQLKEDRQSFQNGDQVELKPEYADNAGEVYTVSQSDTERGRCWIGDEDGRGWYARFDQLIPSNVEEARATKTRLDPKCWKGKHIGDPATKVKNGVRVNNCVPNESQEDLNSIIESRLYAMKQAGYDIL